MYRDENFKLEFFISYSSKDKELAGEIKRTLESYGFQVFLAHEDIEPTAEWETIILENLGECDVFVPLINSNFRESMWTDQETGIALAFKKYIIPINAGMVPYGFIAKFQALKHRTCGDTSKKIFELLVKTPLLDDLKDSLITELINSDSFSEANRFAKLLEDLHPFNINQVNKMVKGYFDNRQIAGGFKSKRLIKKIAELYGDIMDSSSLNAILSDIEKTAFSVHE